jgi:hypothetical protein
MAGRNELMAQVKTVKRKLDEKRDGLQAVAAELQHGPLGERLTAIVTYEVVDKGSHVESGDYTTVKPIHIEPITYPETLQSVQELQQSAYQNRTGESTLTFPEHDEKPVADEK